MKAIDDIKTYGIPMEFIMAIGTDGARKQSKCRHDPPKLILCDRCSIVWERSKKNRSRDVYYFADLPKYGLPEETCPKCRVNYDRNNTKIQKHNKNLNGERNK